MFARPRLLLVVIALSVAFVGAACGSSGPADSTADTTTSTAPDDGSTSDTTTGADSSAPTTIAPSGSFGIGLANLKLDGNGHRIEFSSDEGSCEVDAAAGTAKVSVSKDGSTLDLDYDKSDPAAATIKFTGDGLAVNGGAGASTPAITDVVVSDGEVTGKATLDSPSEGAGKVYLGQFDILCP